MNTHEKRKMSAALRYLEILKKMPLSGKGTGSTVQQLTQGLKDDDISISERTVLRDLEDLEEACLVQRDTDQKPHIWTLLKTPLIDMQHPSNRQDALMLCLAQAHLQRVMPAELMQRMQSSFDVAQGILNVEETGFSRWKNRVRSISSGPQFQVAEIDPDIWQALSEALQKQQQLEVEYESRTKGGLKKYRLHIHGIVAKEAATYVLAYINDYSDFTRLAVHRIKSANVSWENSRACSDDEYNQFIECGGMGWGTNLKTKKLVVDVHKRIVQSLEEMKISDDQKITPVDDSDWFRLEATVPDNQETQWWVNSLGENVQKNRN